MTATAKGRIWYFHTYKIITRNHELSSFQREIQQDTERQKYQFDLLVVSITDFPPPGVHIRTPRVPYSCTTLNSPRNYWHSLGCLARAIYCAYFPREGPSNWTY